MFTVLIEVDQKKYAWDIVSKHNFGNRGDFDGNKEMQYTGILGEVVFSDLIGDKRPDGENGFDGGIDFVIYNQNVDLKTMGRKSDVKDYYVNNLVASQTKYQTHFYLFASINKVKSEITFIGIIKKVGLKKYFHKKGEMRNRSDGTSFEIKRDMYEIPNKDLYQFNDIQELVWAFDKLS